MKVFVVCGDPKVRVSGHSDGLELELVAHFLGMALHQNDNAEPSANPTRLVSTSSFPKRASSPDL
ncbi:hypothetical protein [Sulfitobacter sp. R18_1]|uniref:hypothetical protein n=1 Tax=Sulfitobacter sp. R18_1 TaxID=2821104 RepID=UPI001ADBA93D|nr:hypothetical protein [Sulfitobacter sp. R18_1]MBO9428103.1 hypothetical protein [Sulfitobacter sp. R18_1]